MKTKKLNKCLFKLCHKKIENQFSQDSHRFAREDGSTKIAMNTLSVKVSTKKWILNPGSGLFIQFFEILKLSKCRKFELLKLNVIENPKELQSSRLFVEIVNGYKIVIRLA
jgi:hypothetical protein